MQMPAAEIAVKNSRNRRTFCKFQFKVRWRISYETSIL